MLTAGDAHFTATFPARPQRTTKNLGTITVIAYLAQFPGHVVGVTYLALPASASYRLNRGINGIAAGLPAGKVISRRALTYRGGPAEDAAISSSAGVMQVRALRFGSSAYLLEGAGITPASFAHDYQVLLDTFRPRVAELEAAGGAEAAEQIAPNWRLQLGSLGSGNHFIEISLDEQARVWLFRHSGSRGAGHRLAVQHIRTARAECTKWWISLPGPGLAYLGEGTAEFGAYIRGLRWAQHFAALNRPEMMDRVAACLGGWTGRPVQRAETAACHHNYTEREKHFGKQVWLSRQGAIDATTGTPGLIPGSMGTASYIVAGTGNRLALNSSPHGAGRAYGRKAAERAFTRAQLDAAMAGIEWRHTGAFLDEIPAACKPIGQVMTDAAGLVEVRRTLRQVINVKGD